MTSDEVIAGGGRFATAAEGPPRALLAYAKRWPARVWAIEGCNGIGRHVAVSIFTTGQRRKTGATDAHSVALFGVRMGGLRPVVNDEHLAVLRMLVDRRRSLGRNTPLRSPSCIPFCWNWSRAARFATLAALCEVLKCQPGDLLRWEVQASGRMTRPRAVGRCAMPPPASPEDSASARTGRSALVTQPIGRGCALERVCRLSRGDLTGELGRCLSDAMAGANPSTALQGLADRDRPAEPGASSTAWS